jgi:hypothetical protein
MKLNRKRFNIKVVKSWSVRKGILEKASHTNEILDLDRDAINIEYIKALELYASNEMTMKFNELLNNTEFLNWYNKNYNSDNPELYYPPKYVSKQYQLRSRFNESFNTKIIKTLNSNIKKLIAINGMDVSKLPTNDSYTDNETITPIPLSKPFYDTMIAAPVFHNDFENVAKEKIKVLKEELNSCDLKVKFLPHGNWLLSTATIPSSNVTKFLNNTAYTHDIQTFDYTQDFTASVKSDCDLYDNRFELYSKTLADSLITFKCDNNTSTLYKGSFKYNGEKFYFKVYDKIESFLNNTGVNDIGLTVVKSILEPREPWIKEHLHGKDGLIQTHSILRVEVTIPLSKRHIKSKLLKRAIDYARPLFTTGDLRKYFTSYFQCKRPQVILDCREMQSSEVQKNALWFFDDDIDNTGLYNGKVILAYWIENNYAKSSIQGFVFDDVESALQKCLGNRVITVLTLDGNGNINNEKTIHYGIDKDYKPIASQYETFTGRGYNQPIPLIIQDILPWSNGKYNKVPRRISEIKENTLRHNMSYELIESTSKVQVETENYSYQLPNTLKGIKYGYADATSYRKKQTVHEIAVYGIVDNKAVFIRKDGKLFKSKVKSSIENPKYYFSHEMKYTKYK